MLVMEGCTASLGLLAIQYWSIVWFVEVGETWKVVRPGCEIPSLEIVLQIQMKMRDGFEWAETGEGIYVDQGEVGGGKPVALVSEHAEGLADGKKP